MRVNSAEGFWRTRLDDVTEPTQLGVERHGPQPDDPARTSMHLTWDADQAAALSDAAARAGVSAELFTIAAWGLVLGAYAGTDDVVFGATGGQQPHTVPVRVRIDPALLLPAYLAQVRDDHTDGQLHAGLSSAELHACTGLPEGTPVFDKVISFGPAGSAHPIDLSVYASPTRVELRLSYATSRLAKADAQRLLAHTGQMLTAMAAAPTTARLRDLTVLSTAERDRALTEWNATTVHREDAPCVHELFEQQAARTPDALAVVQGADRLTYSELDEAANRVANRLAAAGVGPGDFVGLHVKRTVHMVVALLGVLKAGAAYAPLEPSLPVERIRSLLAGFRVPVVLTDLASVPDMLEVVAGLPNRPDVLWLGAADAGNSPAAGAGWALEHPAAGAPAPLRATPADLAYVIFTSGSTGTPKGVLLTHAPVVNLIRWVNDTFRFGPEDQVLFITSMGFDLSVYDVFGVLAAGGSVRVVAEDDIRDPVRLLSIMDTEPITFWDSAPAALQQLEPFLANRDPDRVSKLRLVFLSGDWVPLTLPDSVRSAFGGCEVVALGGATEAAIWSNYFPVGKVDPDWSSVPYGRPIDNARYYVLDVGLQPAAVGAPGDLYIGGDCLATGYHGDAELTAQKFVPDHLSGQPGARLYRTGDRVRYWADGTIEFLGRQDHQVKIRGYRIELGEIEATLAALPEVASAVVAIHRLREDAQLVGYVLPAPGSSPDPAALREYLAARLPAYTVPSHVMVLDSLPVTATGKLDRRGLPTPDTAMAARPPYVEPSTTAEQVVAMIWAEILEVDQVGLDDNFFDLGGHSLLITRLIARLKSDIDVDVPIAAVLDYQTVGAFAAVVEGALVAEFETAVAPMTGQHRHTVRRVR